MADKPSHQVEGSYADFEWKKKTYGLLRAFRYVYGHQNTAHRTGACLKRGQCAIPVSSIVIQLTRVAVSVYAVSSKKTEVMITEQIGHTAANVDAP